MVSRVPARLQDASGAARIDLGAVVATALPMMLNSCGQLALNLTDSWFIGRLSTEAMAALGAVHYLAIMFLLALGGAGLAVQSFVAQAVGAGRPATAAASLVAGLWAALAVTPAFLAVAWAGEPMLSAFGLDAAVTGLAAEWWWPRLLGGPLVVGLWAVSGYFNGHARGSVTLLVTVATVVLNALLNHVFMDRLGLGIAGSAWATTLSNGAGCVFGLALFIRGPGRRARWRAAPPIARLRRLFAVGIPTGLFPAVDLVALSLFQLMQVRLGSVEGAATQIVMMLTSLAYLPGLGLALAGTTLVGQSIGAGDPAWAQRLGNAVALLAFAFMGAVGLAIGLAGPWLVPLFVAPNSADAAAVVTLALSLTWIAGAYQAFDGLNLAAAFCLRGADDVRVPALLLALLAWCGFVPLAHLMSFAPGQGWITAAPGLGLGAMGGWWAALAYMVALGLLMLWRWRSGAWRRARLT